jgi:tRNA G18 (ribose-2'-O)-methylase SpoU
MKKLSMDELNRVSVEEFKGQEKNPICIVLDNVRSLHNVGSAFRTSDAFSVSKIYLCGITGTPPNREINKTALGATESVAWEYIEETTSITSKLQAEGWIICSIEQVENSISLIDFIPEKDKKYCLVFGNEVDGVELDVIKQSDKVIEIPQFGTKHSLNVSVSLGIVVWDMVAKLGR